ncbi:MAG TPA: GNAT family protein [Candidatus Limnocylindria bacterium]|nr:GNAT family protein [Candidatus Limnocylindria bacterium]
MIGPRIAGERGVSLVPATLEHAKLRAGWMAAPEATRFWGLRLVDARPERAEERFKKDATDPSSVSWTIAYEGEPVGFTGIFDIDWVARDGESGLFIGRTDLYGRGIATEAVRLRTAYAWAELRLVRVHNWIGLRNRGSRRANEKAGYRQVGRFDRSWFRSGQWYDEWLGEVLLPEALDRSPAGS